MQEKKNAVALNRRECFLDRRECFKVCLIEVQRRACQILDKNRGFLYLCKNSDTNFKILRVL